MSVAAFLGSIQNHKKHEKERRKYKEKEIKKYNKKQIEDKKTNNKPQQNNSKNIHQIIYQK